MLLKFFSRFCWMSLVWLGLGVGCGVSSHGNAVQQAWAQESSGKTTPPSTPSLVSDVVESMALASLQLNIQETGGEGDGDFALQSGAASSTKENAIKTERGKGEKDEREEEPVDQLSMQQLFFHQTWDEKNHRALFAKDVYVERILLEESQENPDKSNLKDVLRVKVTSNAPVYVALRMPKGTMCKTLAKALTQEFAVFAMQGDEKIVLSKGALPLHPQWEASSSKIAIQQMQDVVEKVCGENNDTQSTTLFVDLKPTLG